MHDHHNKEGGRSLQIALGITFLFFVVELIGGMLTNSLALLTDAWHMLNDVFALASALVAAWLAKRPATDRRTYGYYRAEVVAAFLNGIFLWVVVIFIFIEAFHRFQNPAHVETMNMLVVAFFGLLANGLSAYTLEKSKEESLNVKGAFLHVLADTLGSLGAISAGLIMHFTGWYQIDPLISVIIGVLIFYSSGRLLKDTINVLLEGVPPGIDANALERRILGMEGVKDLHDLHVWCITPTRMCLLSAHVVVDREVDRKMLMKKMIDTLKEEFGIDHTTIQMEDEDYPKAASEHK